MTKSSEKIIIRPIVSDDLDNILRIRNSDFVRNYSWNNNIILYEEHINWFNNFSKNNTICNFSIVKNVDLIGVCGLKLLGPNAEFSIYIKDAECGKGYGSEAMKKLIGFGFDDSRVGCHINKIWGTVFSFNLAALKCYESLGFKKEGVLRGHLLRNEKYFDVYIVGLLRGEWCGADLAESN